MRVRLSSVPSLEETGLDAILYGERQPFPAPRELPTKDSMGKGVRPNKNVMGSGRMPEKVDETFHDALDAVHANDGAKSEASKRPRHLGEGKMEGEESPSGQGRLEDGIDMATGDIREENGRRLKSDGRMESVGKRASGETFAQVWARLAAQKGDAPKNVENAMSAPGSEGGDRRIPNLGSRLGNYRSSSVQRTTSSNLRHDRLSGIDEGDLVEESPTLTPRGSQDLDDPLTGGLPSVRDEGSGNLSGNLESPGQSMRLTRSSSGARNRWRRLKHTVQFAAHMSQMRQGSNDLLEENAHLQRQNSMKEEAGVTGAAAFDGAKTGAVTRPKGRKGMDGMMVRQDKSFITRLQDFYVACLKMPMGQFLLGVFVAPVALGLLFTPIFLLDMGGLSFDGTTLDETFPSEGSVAAAKRRCTALLNVFLYSLSLSTTFGGSPVNALSPFCLLVANVNTLMAQFLFVFLSGAVFARMSQPSHPVRCSKKAIIRNDDFVPTPGEEKQRIFAVRLVLTGPAPCELVDAKICLTFRIFVKLPSGSMFCSTQDLELVRPEVSYLRYGLMVRHIIDKKSPVYGHTMETLREGDASFSLTIMGLERTSMQPIFHLEDYFVCDGDIVWDGDYMDFIHINRDGQRVLDHSKIDLLKTFKVAGMVSQAISRMEADVAKRKENEEKARKGEEANGKPGTEEENPEGLQPSKGWVGGLRTRKLWKSKSTSFTRAPDW